MCTVLINVLCEDLMAEVQGDQYQSGMVTQEVSDVMHYILSTSWYTHTKLHRENVTGSFS